MGSMTRRINIVLPEATIRTIDRMAQPGERSRFINRAVEHYIETQSAEALRKQLELAAVRDRDLDREIVSDWMIVDQQTWQQLDQKQNRPKAGIRSAGKSTSRRSIRP